MIKVMKNDDHQPQGQVGRVDHGAPAQHTRPSHAGSNTTKVHFHDDNHDYYDYDDNSILLKDILTSIISLIFSRKKE